MATLSELTVQVLTARLAKRDMSLEELQKEMLAISTMLKGIDEGTLQEPVTEAPAEAPQSQKINFKQIFKKDEVICLICNKGFKTLKRHLSMAHDLKPGAYKKQFNIPAKFNLIASAYSAERKKAALDRGQGEILAKARAVRAANKVAAIEVKVAEPAVKVKATAPLAKKKVTVQAEKNKTA